GQSRTAASLLAAVGLEDLVARTEEEYVKINLRLAGDLPRLGEMRASLRARMQDSPLMNYRALTSALEDSYRRIWTDWTLRQPSPH
ncbi:MAG: hypothetical protein D4R74_10405, partial [Betaproteobacteria bacterium]